MIRLSVGVEMRRLNHPAHQHERNAKAAEHHRPGKAHFGEHETHATPLTIDAAAGEQQTLP
jgi:hypothetical protein